MARKYENQLNVMITSNKLMVNDDKNEVIDVEMKNELSPFQEDDVFSFIGESDELSAIMELLTDGKTKEFDAQVMLDNLNSKTLLKGVQNQCYDLVKLCLIAGVSPDGMATSYDGTSNNLLAIAIQKNDMRIIELLLEAGANPNGNANLESEGHPLLAAIETKNLDIFIKLLERNVKTDVSIFSGLDVRITPVFKFDDQVYGDDVVQYCSIKKYTSPLHKAMEMYYDSNDGKNSEISKLLSDINMEDISFENKVDPSQLRLTSSAEDNTGMTTALSISSGTGRNISHLFNYSGSQIILASDVQNNKEIPHSVVFQHAVKSLDKEPLKSVSTITKMIYLLMVANADCLNNFKYEEIFRPHYKKEMKYILLSDLRKKGGISKLDKLLHVKFHSHIAMAAEKGDLSMVRFLYLNGAKFRELDQKQKLPIVSLDFSDPCSDMYFHKDLSINDEIIGAVKSGNAKLLDWLITHNATVKYKLPSYFGALHTAVRGMAEAIENDDINMVSIFMHHGVSLTDAVFYWHLSNYKNKKFDTHKWYCADWNAQERLVFVNDVIDDPTKKNVYDMFRDNLFESRYQILKKVWLIEEKVAEKKRKDAEQQRLKAEAEKVLQAEREKLLEEEKRIKETAKLMAEQMLLEEKKKATMVLGYTPDVKELANQVKNLTKKVKLNPRGKDFALIQQLALMGGLYQVAKEEPAEIVNVWVPLFERIVDEKESKKLISLQKRLNKKKNTRQKS